MLGEDDLKNDKDKFLLKIETHIEVAMNSFDAFVASYIDNQTKCPLGKADVADGYNKFLEDIECNTDCRVERLWRSSKGKLKKLVVAGGQNPHNTNKGFCKGQLPLIQNAIEDCNDLKSKTKCKKAGDTIIALEMPERLKMLTFDKAFESLCGILDKEVHVIPSTTALRKSQKIPLV